MWRKRGGKWREDVPFFCSNSPASVRAACASRGREVRMTEADMGRGRSATWSESGMGVSGGDFVEAMIAVVYIILGRLSTLEGGSDCR